MLSTCNLKIVKMKRYANFIFQLDLTILISDGNSLPEKLLQRKGDGCD